MSADLGYAAALVVAAVFLVAGVAKLSDRPSTAATFTALGVPAAHPLATAVPLAEIVLGAGLVVAPRPAAVGGLVLLAAFTVVVVTALRRGVRVGCGCFGTARRQPISFVEVARNAMLAVATAVALLAPAPRWPGLAAVVAVTGATAAAAVVLALLEVKRANGTVFSLDPPLEVR
jgi:uncharacterized membrane protein YphA (DoxX/SURF4 family)